MAAGFLPAVSSATSEQVRSARSSSRGAAIYLNVYMLRVVADGSSSRPAWLCFPFESLEKSQCSAHLENDVDRPGKARIDAQLAPAWKGSRSARS